MAWSGGSLGATNAGLWRSCLTVGDEKLAATIRAKWPHLRLVSLMVVPVTHQTTRCQFRFASLLSEGASAPSPRCSCSGGVSVRFKVLQTHLCFAMYHHIQVGADPNEILQNLKNCELPAVSLMGLIQEG